MTNRTVLFPEERKIFSEGHGELVGEVQAGGGVFRAAGPERVLRRKQRIARGTGSEDFAHVIGVPAPSVTGANRQLLEQVGGAELRLDPMVGRESAVSA